MTISGHYNVVRQTKIKFVKHAREIIQKIVVKIKVKSKVLPRTGHEGSAGEKMYSSTLPSTSTLDGGGWSTPQPGRFTHEKDPVTIVQEAGWAPRPVWKDAENLVPTGIRSPDRPARSNSLYRLSYSGRKK